MKVLFQSAAIWEDRYQNLANADACIEGVLAIDPQNLQAIKTLERLRRAQGRWEELVGVLERHIQLATDAAGAGRARAWRWATSSTSSSSRWTARSTLPPALGV